MAIKLDELEGIGETIADSKARVTLARALRQLRARFGDRKIRLNAFIEESTGAIVLAPATMRCRCGRRGSTRTPRR